MQYSGHYYGESGTFRYYFPGASFAKAYEIYISDDRLTGTAADVQATLSGQMLVYELATPVTYTLTTEQLTALKGTNNLWADCGPVEAKYWTH